MAFLEVMKVVRGHAGGILPLARSLVSVDHIVRVTPTSDDGITTITTTETTFLVQHPYGAVRAALREGADILKLAS
jgi:hypothetical protein